jgi:CheY-like chemotaxis protein
VLRQDPNVIFVGEIRDVETAQTAAHAALTGHLVLSTLHTNDAIGVISRLLDLGLDRTTIGTALRGAVAQRLIRKLCANCAIPVTEPLTPDEVRLSKLSSVRPVRRAVGCERCTQSGYFGRTAIAEVLVITPALDNLIATGAPMQAILRQARSEGMRLLTVGALEAVTDGTTTLEEIERVVGFADFAPETTKPRVLVVDDDPVIRGVVVALLEKEGFESVQVGDGSAAIELVTGGEALDLVILDLNLPSMHGREVLRRLRAAQATQRLPVVILTGSSDERLEPELMDEGADDYLRKPIDPARFVSRVKAVLRRSARQ